jgi:hypothetical protein
VQLGELLAQLPPGLQQNLHEFAQIWQALYELPDALFEFGGADNANLEAEIAQQAADIVVYGDGFFLKQLARRLVLRQARYRSGSSARWRKSACQWCASKRGMPGLI